MWVKGLMFTLNIYLKDFFKKMKFHWYMTPGKLATMYKNTSNNCWKYDQHEGHFTI